MKHMEPVVAPLVPDVCLALGNLVGVVGERIVDSAAVNVQLFAQIFQRDAGALNMPAGITDSPRAFSFKLLGIKFGLCEPKHKIRLVSLICVSLDAVAHADRQILFLKIVENIVFIEL